jgi:hypothetical protein
MLPSIVSSADLAAAVVKEQLPLIFLDTAAILDILRVPYRRNVQFDIIESAAVIIGDSFADPRRLWAVTTANVFQEFQEHREAEQRELESRISDLNLTMARLSRVAGLVFPERRISHVDWLGLSLHDRVCGIMDRLIASLIVFRGTAECIGKARDRVWAGLPPATKSKQEYKDCEIFEEFLEVVSTLRSRGFDKTAVFVTPNKRDYGDPPRGHDQIASDLEAARAIYAANISWALASVRKAAG